MIRIVLICLGVLIGAALLGVSLSSEAGPAKISTRDLEDLDVPPEVRDMMPEYVHAVSRGLRVAIMPLRAVLGGTIGGIIGFAISFVVSKRRGPVSTVASKSTHRPRNTARHNLKVFFVFVVLAFVLWLVFIRVLIQGVMSDSVLNDVKFYVAAQLAGLFAIAFSGLVVCREIVLSKKWATRMNTAMLGPFNRRKIPFLNERQTKVVWLGIVVALMALFFPPWVAYGSAVSDIGNTGIRTPIGTPIFAGFHFVISSKLSVLGEAPYVIAEISWKVLGILELCLLAVCLILIFLFAGPEKQAKAGR